tara:strand:+ start:17016 stop:17876 length:861 start_codon:yes stop_codon:yes gene_type:complete
MKRLFSDFKNNKEEFSHLLYANSGVKNELRFWKDSDDEHRFNNLPGNSHRKIFWKDKTLEYRYNNYGFRTDDDFNSKDEGIITLGCSFTEGIGLPIEYNWGYRLAKYLNLKHWNLGQGAKGLDTAFRLLLGYGDMLKFKKVFLFVPPFYRNELIIEDNKIIRPFLSKEENRDMIHTLGPSNGDLIFLNLKEEYDEFLKSIYFGSEMNEVIRMVRGLAAIKGLCEFLGVDFYYLTFSSHFNKESNLLAEKIPDSKCPHIPARDIHWSSKKQYLIYQNFIEKYGIDNW